MNIPYTGDHAPTDSEQDGGSTGGERGWQPVVWRLARGLLLATGIIVFAVGVLSIRQPDEQFVSVEPAIAALGSDYSVVAIVGIVAVALSAVVGVVTHTRGVGESNPSRVERVPTAPSPGHSLDVTPSTLGSWRRPKSEDSQRDRLRTAAVEATLRAKNCSRGDARRQVATGAWTDTETAAWWLADAEHVNAATRDVDRETTTNPRIVSRTVTAIARLTEQAETADDQPTGSGRST